MPLTLGLHNIYILPTGYGLIYMLVLGAMLIGSINYNNNLGFLLTFLLGSLGLTGMLHTYSMLYGLRLISASARPVFAGNPVEVILEVDGMNRPRKGLCWYFNKNDQAENDIGPGEKHQILARGAVGHRGMTAPGWLRIVSTYPLGLFCAWARIDTNLKCLVYPRPIAQPISGTDNMTPDGEREVSTIRGVDDFQGLSGYQPGDPLTRIYWPAYSRGRGLYTKSFTGQMGASVMLDFETIKGDDTEKKLSILCFNVLKAHNQQQHFGLNIPGKSTALAKGKGHRDRCLKMLALYGRH